MTAGSALHVIIKDYTVDVTAVKNEAINPHYPSFAEMIYQ